LYTLVVDVAPPPHGLQLFGETTEPVLVTFADVLGAGLSGDAEAAVAGRAISPTLSNNSSREPLILGTVPPLPRGVRKFIGVFPSRSDRNEGRGVVTPVRE
jgi:hypothetical protein